MKELRVDELTGDRVIYTSFRSKRPYDKLKSVNDFDDKDQEYNENCPFCRGNETEDDSLMEKILSGDDWIAKSVANKFPIVDTDSEEIFGNHEVIVENHRHNATFFNMNENEFEAFLKLYRNRYKYLEEKDGVESVTIFKNYKRGSGASLMHPHSQIVSLNILPPEIEKEIKVADEYKRKNHKNLYDSIINRESNLKDRVIYEGKYFISFVPHATRYNGEIRIIEKDLNSVSEWCNNHIKELAYILKNLFLKIEEVDGDIPFNVLIHSIPKNLKGKCELRTHLHIVPRKYNFGGFELSTNLFVCGSDAKDLASRYRF